MSDNCIELKDGEYFKEVEGFSGLYAITSFGRIWKYSAGNLKGRWLKTSRTGDSYVRVPLQKEGNRYWRYFHRLVAEAFVPNPQNKKYVNHIDGIKHNCNSDNLEWVTAYENHQHACDKKLHPHYKLSARDKFTICELYQSGKATVKELSVKYDVVSSNIYRLLKNYPRMKEQLTVQ
jgi:hypothetical protein